MIAQKPAIAYGGTLDEDVHGPATLPEALARATHQEHEEKGITYLQIDGSEIFQSYTTLLEETKSVLVGRQSLGLHPGDMVNAPGGRERAIPSVGTPNDR